MSSEPRVSNLNPRQFVEWVAPKPLGDWESPGDDPAGRPMAPRTPDSSSTGFLVMKGHSDAGTLQYGLPKPNKNVIKRVVEGASGRLVPTQDVANKMKPSDLS